MSKDVTLSGPNLPSSTTSIRLEDDVMELLYDKLDGYPVLWRLVKGFYDDVDIDREELPKLKEEIVRLLSTRTEEPKTIEKKKRDYPKALAFLKELEDLCDEGIKRGLGIWAYAD